jgi:hypothetical protein
LAFRALRDPAPDHSSRLFCSCAHAGSAIAGASFDTPLASPSSTSFEQAPDVDTLIAFIVAEEMLAIYLTIRKELVGSVSRRTKTYRLPVYALIERRLFQAWTLGPGNERRNHKKGFKRRHPYSLSFRQL